jgi:hypothetical protein
MENVNLVSSSEFHVLSNGALVFAVSLILCSTGKWIELFAETLLAFKFNLAYRKLKCTSGESGRVWSRINIKDILLGRYFVFAHDFCLQTKNSPT